MLQQGIRAAVRKAEARYIPIHLRNTLQSTGQWGEVRVILWTHAAGGLTENDFILAAKLDAEVIVNLQGDEPELEPAYIDQLVDLMAADAEIPIGTLACPFPDGADPSDPNAVKVVIDGRGRALYFSRALVPYPRDTGGKVTEPRRWLLHLGIYAYRRDFLLKLAEMAPTPHEKEEKLEQLRILENGFALAVGIVRQATVGIDTPEDYEAFLKWWSEPASAQPRQSARA